LVIRFLPDRIMPPLKAFYQEAMYDVPRLFRT
jgi:hypothetical protein